MEHREPQLYGVMAEFDSVQQFMHAAEQVRDAGYQHMDAYAPFPVEGLSEALGLKRNKVALTTLIGGLCGGLGGFGFEYWVNVVSYPMNIAGRPLNSWPAFIPVTFELTVLGASLAAVFGMIAMNGLPRPHHPVFNIQRFARASTDRFFICIEATDPKFKLAETARFLESLHPQHVTEVQDD
jgi:ActD protein